MPIKAHNLFSHLPAAKSKEVFTNLLKAKGIKIERIVSNGQRMPKDEWLCENSAEWAMVVQGAARLEFKGKKKMVNLKRGDYIFIPSKTYHRVDWTSKREKTVWLAVHF